MNTNGIPKGFHTITPNTIVKNVDKAVEFYIKVFGAEEVLRLNTPDGKIVNIIKTDLDEIGGRPAENWPFTAIRLENGNTVASLTHGNKVAEFNPRGELVWKVTNDDVKGLFKDPCGAQRLANGNTVVGSHAASTGISMVEVTPDKQIVWTSEQPLASGVHHFQILTTNGKPEPGPPLK